MDIEVIDNFLDKESFKNIPQAPIDGGHFFPDQYPKETLAALSSFISNNLD